MTESVKISNSDNVAMSQEPLIRQLIQDCSNLPWEPLKNHKTAKHPIHKLAFLADTGIKKEYPGMEKITGYLFEHQAESGAFQTVMAIPKVFGGDDKESFCWMLCDAPLILSTLCDLGYEQDDPRLLKAAEHIAGLIRDNGWPCAASIPKFKGPGKREHPCPYSTLLSLRALSNFKRFNTESVCGPGTEMLLSQWENRKSDKYFLFAMGTDFQKLKYPFVWYDILHVLEVLSRFKWVHQDIRFKEMLDIVISKADSNGEYTPESVWMAFKGFDFTQKKESSPTLSMIIERIRMRINRL